MESMEVPDNSPILEAERLHLIEDAKCRILESEERGQMVNQDTVKIRV